VELQAVSVGHGDDHRSHHHALASAGRSHLIERGVLENTFGVDIEYAIADHRTAVVRAGEEQIQHVEPIGHVEGIDEIRRRLTIRMFTLE
jgi:hypothetical protein